MNWRKTSWVALHLGLWSAAFLVLSPWPIVRENAFEMEPFTPLLSQGQTAFFLAYGFLLNAALVYLYAHWVLPRYARQPRLTFLIVENLAGWLGFALFESLIDIIYFETLGIGAEFPRGLIIYTNFVFTGGALLLANFYGFAYAWVRDRRLRSALEKEKLRAELSALKHQINPHFLFNILNALYGMAYEHDDEPTAEGIGKLSQMMRYVLYDAVGDEVALSKELACIENYIELQQLRISEKVEVEFSVEGDLSGHLIPPMILLPFVENAFKYGISQLKPSRINIRAEVSPQQLRFIVENTKHRVLQEQTKNRGIGLQNVRKRLDLRGKRDYRLDIQDTDDNFVVSLELALEDPLRRRFPILFSGAIK